MEPLTTDDGGTITNTTAINCHRLLRGGKQPYPHSLSSRQMESLAALCDTFHPSIDASSIKDEDLCRFYKTSASMIGVPEHYAGYLYGTLKNPRLDMLFMVFWLLSTWFGTFITCGTASLSGKFPYFQRFSQVSQKKREEIVLSWSLSYFNIFNMLYKCLKFLINRIFFTLVDEKNMNPSWKAIGYCGPDPNFAGRLQNEETEKPYGPLHEVLVDMETPRPKLLHILEQSGFTVAASLDNILTIHTDVVVVGSGSGGGVVAGVLAKAGYKVLVLEKGNYFARQNLSLLEGPTLDEMYERSGFLASDDLGALLLAGSTVGGGSTINWAASIRTPTHVINEWSKEYGLQFFNEKSYKEALDIICERMGVHEPDLQKEGLSNQVLRKGCLELGYPVNTIPCNAPPDHSCGWCNLGCKDGKKKGTQETWLVDMATSGNGVILPKCRASKILYDKKTGYRNKAKGVVFEFEKENGKKETHLVMSKVTIVASGALNTPALLVKSGLRNPNIGKHLHIHPTIVAWGYFPSDTPLGQSGGDNKKSYEGPIMSAMSAVVGNFDTSGYGAVIQTPSVHPGMFSIITPWLSSIDFKQRMSRYSRTAHLFALARDKGSGSVHQFPNSLEYHLDATDEKNLMRGLEKLLRILAAAGAEEIGTNHVTGERLNVKHASSKEFEDFVSKASSRGLKDHSTPITSAHQMGSCRMGIDPKQSVVNQRGETWEVEGLFLADTSVFPTALGVNPMVTVQAISYCTAQSVMEFLKGVHH
ncbi:Long-chain-alcohol oxidase fao4a [Thalictrum thalictroides]|uniref:Long-chain-alcohol oxidase n=1 Tax=Thalictrum thalictroides TaxID=46969 RepID=A0A7J6VIE2_THATH|nr:Long-chain-alcohol oxidase fao4a [Thalictrum thalictroides]